jgi:hypothetical protein
VSRSAGETEHRHFVSPLRSGSELDVFYASYPLEQVNERRQVGLQYLTPFTRNP